MDTWHRGRSTLLHHALGQALMMANSDSIGEATRYPEEVQRFC